ncbi:MAG: OmpA family protein, partial [Rhizobiales bacterium]|nr:OmpA family protein [Hyphomicrobiales bacterium]
NAATLSVAIPDAKIAAELGKDAALSSDGKGNWSLTLAQKLAPGAYDVVATETAKDGRTAKDASSAEIYVKAPPSPPPPPPPELKVPTVATFTGQSSPKAITGSWDEANATALSVAIPDAKVSAELGKDPNLISDGKGHWALVLKQNLAHGTYDVVVTETAKDGRMAKDASTGEIVVKAAPPPPSPPPPPPYDCVGVLAKVSATFPILFDFAEEKLHPPYDLSVNQAAALLKDPRCASLKAEVTGYADYYGGRLYNVALSVQRAQVVVDALIAAGVDGSRLSVTGLGKSNPLDPSHNRLARAKNRRVVITIVKSE